MYRLREDLGKFLLGHAADFACVVEENTAVGGGAGVQGHDVFCHKDASLGCV